MAPKRGFEPPRRPDAPLDTIPQEQSPEGATSLQGLSHHPNRRPRGPPRGGRTSEVGGKLEAPPVAAALIVLIQVPSGLWGRGQLESGWDDWLGSRFGWVGVNGSNP